MTSHSNDDIYLTLYEAIYILRVAPKWLERHSYDPAKTDKNSALKTGKIFRRIKFGRLTRYLRSEIMGYNGNIDTSTNQDQ